MHKSYFSRGRKLQDKYCKKEVESAYFNESTDKRNELLICHDINYLL